MITDNKTSENIDKIKMLNYKRGAIHFSTIQPYGTRVNEWKNGRYYVDGYIVNPDFFGHFMVYFNTK